MLVWRFIELIFIKKALRKVIETLSNKCVTMHDREKQLPSDELEIHIQDRINILKYNIYIYYLTCSKM